MKGFIASFADLTSHELAEHILREAGQLDRNAINPADILKLLGLEYLSFDFAAELRPEIVGGGGTPRALLSFPDRVVAVDSHLADRRQRFSVIHEVGHYVLPQHQHQLYLCDKKGMSSWTNLDFEKSANAFAADILFMGNRFTAEANSGPPSAAAVKMLATQYDMSFEATARRLVEKSLAPCMLIVFKSVKDGSQIDSDCPTKWPVRYSAASPRFAENYTGSISRGEVPPHIAAAVTVRGRDIADSLLEDVLVRFPDDTSKPYQGEFFSNQWNIFCILTPSRQDA